MNNNLQNAGTLLNQAEHFIRLEYLKSINEMGEETNYEIKAIYNHVNKAIKILKLIKLAEEIK